MLGQIVTLALLAINDATVATGIMAATELRRYSVDAHAVARFQYLNGLFFVRETGSRLHKASLTPSSGDTTYPVPSDPGHCLGVRYEGAAKHRFRHHTF